jgi:dihydropteroate synthase
MQLDPRYTDVTREVIAFFAERIARARETGIRDIIIDPGFGFGKTVDHNYTLLRELSLFEILDCPVAIGISRKSMVYKPLGLLPDDALTGTVALHALGLLNGACILRVHDVKEAVQTVKLIDLYFKGVVN